MEYIYAATTELNPAFRDGAADRRTARSYRPGPECAPARRAASASARYGAAGPGCDFAGSHAGPAHRLPNHRSEEHTSELQSLRHLVCRLLLEKNQNYSILVAEPDADLRRSVLNRCFSHS